MSASTSSEDLIVDFPSSKRVGRFDGMATSPCPVVHFASFSDMFVYEESEYECSKSFSSDEAKRFRRDALRDAVRMATRLRESSSEVTPEELIEVIGIESLLSVELSRRSMAHKRDHVRSVLSAQGRSAASELSLVSQKSSDASRRIAARRANVC
jgi:hypothetical protein